MVQYLDKNSGFSQWNANKNAAKNKGTFSGFLWWCILFIVAWWALGVFMSPKQSVDTAPENVVVEDLSSVPVFDISSADVGASVQGLRITDVSLSNFPASSTDSTTVTLL